MRDAPTPRDRDGDDVPRVHHHALRPAWLNQVREDPLEPELAIVDAHHHLWDRGGGYLLDDLVADLHGGHRIVATVFCQCAFAERPSGPKALRPVGETEAVSAISAEAKRRALATKVCAGIVGHADLELGDAMASVVEAHVEAGRGRFRGIRHVSARDEAFNASPFRRPPPDLLDRPNPRRSMAVLQRFGLSFDAWLYHPQIGTLATLAAACPDLPIVLDHLGGPLGIGPYAGRRDEVYAGWRAAMTELARRDNVVKLGGLGMALCGFRLDEGLEPASSNRLAHAWRPYIETAIDLFGSHRCMFESNFPVDKAISNYTILWNAFKRITAGASSDEKHQLFAGTADWVYRLGLAPTG